VSRGSPEPAWRGAEAFGYPVESNDSREKTALFRAAIAGEGFAPADTGGRPGEAKLAVLAQSPGPPTGSGGAPAHARPPSGRASRA